MALVDCRDCGHKVSDSAAACPCCGAIRKAYNELNWPAFHVSAVAVVISLVAAFLPPTTNLLTRLTTIGLAALTIAIVGWGIPYVAETRRFNRQDKARAKYKPSLRKDDHA